MDGDGAFVLAPPEPTPDRVARAELDYYPTPGSAVEPILPFLPRCDSVLDPACGQGELLRFFPNATRYGLELDARRAEQACQKYARGNHHHLQVGDALSATWPLVGLVVCNPPFTHALEFVQRSLSQEEPRTTHAFLLRLSFLESKERRAFHEAWPSDVYVLSERPKFRPNRFGKMASDNITCAWFVWGPGRGGRWAVL